MVGRKSMTRAVGIVPEYVGFEPDGIPTGDTVELAYDELETIRLLDLEKLSQAETAVRMGVARTTVTSIYERARAKVADSLVNGKRLLVAGGNVAFPPHDESEFAHESKPKQKESIMRVAVTYDDGSVFQHFGKTERFKLYDIDEGKVATSQVIDTQGTGHGALAGFLKGNGVDVLLCGGIGGGAQRALAEQGIELYGGLSGSADQLVAELIEGTLQKSDIASCDHRGHGEGACDHGHHRGDAGCERHHHGRNEGRHNGKGHSCC